MKFQIKKLLILVFLIQFVHKDVKLEYQLMDMF